MKTIIINSSNYVAGSGNQFAINLPSNGVKFNAGDKIAVAGCAIYNSTFNITAARGNNKISIVWNGGTPATYTFTFPDGYYSASDMNAFIQQQCILNGLYMTTNSGSTYVYFVEIATNSVRYAISLNVYPIPTSAQATTLGYSQPSGATWTFPSAAQCPQITINAAFGALVGQSSGTYPATSTVSTAQQYVSTITPIISPIDSYIICCNLINSRLTIPVDVLYSVPISASLGQIINISPSQFLFNDIDPNTYSQIVLSFYDQLFNKLPIIDKDIVITLAIKYANESS
jgi:hypothetical protein